MMGRTLKDVFCRYYALAGYKVPRQAGWDTHGLPIELFVEKKLGIRKEDIGQKISVKKFNDHCREAVHLHLKDWCDLTHKMGYWVDMQGAYSTYSSQYIESVWWTISEIHRRGYLRKGYSVQPYSPMAGTALSSHELNQPGCYREVWDHTIIALFELHLPEHKKAFKGFEVIGGEPVYLAAWTTTPWTLPANTALCVGPDIEYCLIRYHLPHRAPHHLSCWVIMARDALERHGREVTKEEFSQIATGQHTTAQSERGGRHVPQCYEVHASFPGSELTGLSYTPPFDLVDLPPGEIFHRVVSDRFVATSEGTGVVHMAPCYGADDERICRREGISGLHILDDQGHYLPSVRQFGGRPVKPGYAALKPSPAQSSSEPSAHQDKDHIGGTSLDVDLIKDLKSRSLALSSHKYEHSYPHCWRTDHPVIYMPVDAWFITTTKMRDRLMELNGEVQWFPPSTGRSRFHDWLSGVVDWNLSRSRYWGTPLPIWRSRDGSQMKVIGSLSELKSEIDAAIAAGVMTENFLDSFDPDNLSSEHYNQFDLHRTVVDQVVLIGSGGEPLHRENEVIDVWFDSGAMPYAAQHFPFRQRSAISAKAEQKAQQQSVIAKVSGQGCDDDEISEVPFPADFICEGVDQTRGWFYSLHIIAALCFDSVAYKKVLANGLVLDAKGQKMSKRLGNSVDPMVLIQRWGADLVRWFMLSHARPWDQLRFDENQIKESTKKFFDTLWHTYNFYAMYANADKYTGNPKASPMDTSLKLRTQLNSGVDLSGNISGKGTGEKTHEEKLSHWDEWIYSELAGLAGSVDEAMSSGDPCAATRAIQSFTQDKLSNWFVRHNRRRFWQSGNTAQKTQAYRTLSFSLWVVARLMAPYAPMISEILYGHLRASDREHRKDKQAIKASGADPASRATHDHVTNSWYESIHFEGPLNLDFLPRNLVLEQAMDLTRKVTTMALSLREKVRIRVRQPLPTLWVMVSEGEELFAEYPELLNDVLGEINVRELRWGEGEGARWQKTVKADFTRLGKRLGADMKEVAKLLPKLYEEEVSTLVRGGAVTLTLADGREVTIARDDVKISYTAAENLVMVSEGPLTVALSTELTEELIEDGIVRELINRVQKLRKSADLNITDTIALHIAGPEKVQKALQRLREHICSETLARELVIHSSCVDAPDRDDLERSPDDAAQVHTSEYDFDGYQGRIEITDVRARS